jgi:hypothetical protein
MQHSKARNTDKSSKVKGNQPHKLNMVAVRRTNGSSQQGAQVRHVNKTNGSRVVNSAPKFSSNGGGGAAVPKRQRPVRRNAPTQPMRSRVPVALPKKRKLNHSASNNGDPKAPSSAIKRFRSGVNTAPRSPLGPLPAHIGGGANGSDIGGVSVPDDIANWSSETFDEWADVELSLSQLLGGGGNSFGENQSFLASLNLNNSNLAPNTPNLAGGGGNGLSNTPLGLDGVGNSINMLSDF